MRTVLPSTKVAGRRPRGQVFPLVVGQHAVNEQRVNQPPNHPLKSPQTCEACEASAAAKLQLAAFRWFTPACSGPNSTGLTQAVGSSGTFRPPRGPFRVFAARVWGWCTGSLVRPKSHGSEREEMEEHPFHNAVKIDLERGREYVADPQRHSMDLATLELWNDS